MLTTFSQKSALIFFFSPFENRYILYGKYLNAILRCRKRLEYSKDQTFLATSYILKNRFVWLAGLSSIKDRKRQKTCKLQTRSLAEKAISGS